MGPQRGEEGDAAVKRFTSKFDRVELDAVCVPIEVRTSPWRMRSRSGVLTWRARPRMAAGGSVLTSSARGRGMGEGRRRFLSAESCLQRCWAGGREVTKVVAAAAAAAMAGAAAARSQVWPLLAGRLGLRMQQRGAGSALHLVCKACSPSHHAA